MTFLFRCINSRKPLFQFGSDAIIEVSEEILAPIKGSRSVNETRLNLSDILPCGDHRASSRDGSEVSWLFRPSRLCPSPSLLNPSLAKTCLSPPSQPMSPITGLSWLSDDGMCRRKFLKRKDTEHSTDPVSFPPLIHITANGIRVYFSISCHDLGHFPDVLMCKSEI